MFLSTLPKDDGRFGLANIRIMGKHILPGSRCIPE